MQVRCPKTYQPNRVFKKNNFAKGERDVVYKSLVAFCVYRYLKTQRKCIFSGSQPKLASTCTLFCFMIRMLITVMEMYMIVVLNKTKRSSEIL